ncbi:hypothetical protein BW13_00565 [Bifidobacterium sp. UTCIF-37]|uniref:hypothetical protein n=1 Tax=unclassified Bifidobacterium TaxID=2608897 RepID=UPI00112EB2AA|nr:MULTISPECIES: hypothetical protein [unclassified Bifidobacterium]TPF87379.1 hypothetical protein BW13_00565 [Bifidobacterium sp. UTCIF-37]TPF91155.1 hypothetical protein BW11_00565 [Bifidobacterium sp. UTCIF-38]
MNMTNQYSPERDRLRVQVLKILAILVAMLLIMAFAAALYKLDLSRTYDNGGIMITSSAQSSAYVSVADHGSTRSIPNNVR